VSTAQKGDKVKVHYKGMLDDGTEFDSSAGKEPIDFTVGEHKVIGGFENGVVGLAVGEKKRVVIGPEDAYGPYLQDKVATLPRSQLPADIELKPGAILKGETPGGPVMFLVTDVQGDQVTIDGNHPLAGKALTFEIELVEIEKG
jgi:peptidylprolyl isomerase